MGLHKKNLYNCFEVKAKNGQHTSQHNNNQKYKKKNKNNKNFLLVLLTQHFHLIKYYQLPITT